MEYGSVQAYTNQAKVSTHSDPKVVSYRNVHAWLGIEHFKSEETVSLCISMNTKISVFIPLQYGNYKIAVHFWKY